MARPRKKEAMTQVIFTRATLAYKRRFLKTADAAGEDQSTFVRRAIDERTGRLARRDPRVKAIWNGRPGAPHGRSAGNTDGKR